MLTVMPLFHAMAVGLSLQALYNGVPVAVYSMPTPAQLIELIARDRPTVVPLVPPSSRCCSTTPVRPTPTTLRCA